MNYAKAVPGGTAFVTDKYRKEGMYPYPFCKRIVAMDQVNVCLFAGMFLLFMWKLPVAFLL